MTLRAIIAGCAVGLVVLSAAPGAFAETEAARDYKRLSDEMRVKQSTMSPGEYFDLLERSLKNFIRRHPASPEAAEVHLALGTIYSRSGSPEQAVKEIEAYLKSPAEKKPEALGVAKYTLASGYLALDRLEEAEKLLGELTAAGAGVDLRVAEAAKGDLARVPLLRRIRIGSPAANIAGTSHEGKAIDLAKYRGKVVLLDFWAAWCAPCRMEMPNVIKTYHERKSKGFEVIGVSLDEDKVKFSNFIRDNKMDWPQLFDGKGWGSDFAKVYAVNAIPATFLIDRKGILRYKNARGPKLQEAVDKLLAEK